ncbi:YheU family protein [Bdellovibrio sp.]|uniref:YheU family protein n=1 Tax=Bdellovibrio sp. TaxID=28201 RepID=UPI0039E358C7
MNDHRDNPVPPIEVPMDALSPEALRGVIDAFIQREGTDYGVIEAAYETKVEQILRQLKKGDIKIAFDPNTETVGLVTLTEWKRFSQGR